MHNKFIPNGNEPNSSKETERKNVMDRNSDGINECTYDELNAAGAEARKNDEFGEEVDLLTVNLCKKIRNIARW